MKIKDLIALINASKNPAADRELHKVILRKFLNAKRLKAGEVIDFLTVFSEKFFTPNCAENENLSSFIREFSRAFFDKVTITTTFSPDKFQNLIDALIARNIQLPEMESFVAQLARLAASKIHNLRLATSKTYNLLTAKHPIPLSQDSAKRLIEMHLGKVSELAPVLEFVQKSGVTLASLGMTREVIFAAAGQFNNRAAAIAVLDRVLQEQQGKDMLQDANLVKEILTMVSHEPVEVRVGALFFFKSRMLLGNALDVNLVLKFIEGEVKNALQVLGNVVVGSEAFKFFNQLEFTGELEDNEEARAELAKLLGMIPKKYGLSEEALGFVLKISKKSEWAKAVIQQSFKQYYYKDLVNDVGAQWQEKFAEGFFAIYDQVFDSSEARAQLLKYVNIKNLCAFCLYYKSRSADEGDLVAEEFLQRMNGYDEKDQKIVVEFFERLSAGDLLAPKSVILFQKIAEKNPQIKEAIRRPEIKAAAKEKAPEMLRAARGRKARIEDAGAVLYYIDDEAERLALLEEFDEFDLLAIFDSLHNESDREFARKKIAAYSEKYGSEVLIASLISREVSFNSQVNWKKLVRNLHSLGDSLNINIGVPFIGDVIAKFATYFTQVDEIQDLEEHRRKNLRLMRDGFISALRKINDDKSATAEIRLDPPLIISLDGTERELTKLKDIVLLLQLQIRGFPGVDLDATLKDLAARPQIIEVINNTLRFYNAKYISAETYALFEVLNDAIPQGSPKIALEECRSFEELVEEKKKFTVIAKDAAKDAAKDLVKEVGESEIFKILEKSDVTFTEFYEELSPQQRKDLGLFLLSDADLEIIKSWLADELKILQAKLAAMAQPLVGNQADYIQQASLKQKIKSLISEITDLKDKTGEEEKSGLISCFEAAINLKSAEEKQNLSPEIAALAGPIKNAASTAIIKKDWHKFAKNLPAIIEIASFCENLEEFIGRISAALALITQPNCAANLAINLQEIIEKERYKDNPQQAAFAIALFAAAYEPLNSRPDMIASEMDYSDVLKDENNVFLPLNYFLYLLGKAADDLEKADKEAKSAITVHRVDSTMGLEFLEEESGDDISLTEEGTDDDISLADEGTDAEEERLISHGRAMMCKIFSPHEDPSRITAERVGHQQNIMLVSN